MELVIDSNRCVKLVKVYGPFKCPCNSVLCIDLVKFLYRPRRTNVL